MAARKAKVIFKIRANRAIIPRKLKTHLLENISMISAANVFRDHFCFATCVTFLRITLTTPFFTSIITQSQAERYAICAEAEEALFFPRFAILQRQKKHLTTSCHFCSLSLQKYTQNRLPNNFR